MVCLCDTCVTVWCVCVCVCVCVHLQVCFYMWVGQPSADIPDVLPSRVGVISKRVGRNEVEPVVQRKENSFAGVRWRFLSPGSIVESTGIRDVFGCTLCSCCYLVNPAGRICLVTQESESPCHAMSQGNEDGFAVD